MKFDTQPQNQSKINILVVDDEDNIRDTVTRALELAGYAVDGAVDGPEALDMIRRNTYELMLLDMKMPQMDGVEVMERVQRLNPDLLVIVLTGNATIDNAIAAVKLQAVDYLRKPASNKLIVSTVTRVLQEHSEQLKQRKLFDQLTKIVFAWGETHGKKQTITPQTDLETGFLHVRPLLLDPNNHLLILETSPQQTLTLTNGEADVLRAMMQHTDEVLTCRQIAQSAWDNDSSEEDAKQLVRPYVSRLRGKIDPWVDAGKIIRTIRGKGYLLSSLEDYVG